MLSSNKAIINAIASLIGLFAIAESAAQPNGPWNSPLLMAWSQDGRVFSTPTTFQDSSGVPSVIRWKGDTLVAAFQWFREPRTAPTWDRVAVKFSYDAGLTWTEPAPIVIDDLPANYQRPFDPTLAVVDGRIRIYFSSSDGMPVGGLNEIVNTYSAISDDGISYTFEPGARFDHAARPVIDPAVIYFRNEWHYAAPTGLRKMVPFMLPLLMDLSLHRVPLTQVTSSIIGQVIIAWRMIPPYAFMGAARGCGMLNPTMHRGGDHTWISDW